ncbi:MAG: xanthine dehydrogenase accessory protein XdhC [Sulfuriferula sp.]|nr:xanthine dehydrogenase accessory protein XdhC [Sulfuriferula sp.]
MTHWIAELDKLLADGNDVVRIVVAATKGSAPREAGAAMLVHSGGAWGTLGGGQLEFNAIELAYELLARTGSMAHSQRFTLGASLGQCCGGIVDLWWERFTAADRPLIADAHARLRQGGGLVLASLVAGQACRRALFDAAASRESGLLTEEAHIMMDSATTAPRIRMLHRDTDMVLLERLDRKHTPLWLFGAGHVGQAIVGLLRDLPFDITWVDPREDIFPAAVPANVTVLASDAPAAEVRYAPDDAWFLVLTHDHALDYAICAAILARETGEFIGLIGSRTKAARFTHRLAHEGYRPERITCPIGVPGISGKEPATIAVAVAAQLLQLREAQAVTTGFDAAAYNVQGR